jgi:hypothetical protein
MPTATETAPVTGCPWCRDDLPPGTYSICADCNTEDDTGHTAGIASYLARNPDYAD